MRTKEEFLFFCRELDHKGSVKFLAGQAASHRENAEEPWPFSGFDPELDRLRTKAYRLSAQASDAHRAFYERLLMRGER